MRVEQQIDKWVYHRKNRGHDIRQGVVNGVIVAKLEGIAFGELILAPVAHSDTIADGKGAFVLMMKPIDRWVVAWGEFIEDNSEPIYRRTIWGKRVLVGRMRKDVPLGGKILKINKVRFYCFQPLTGIQIRTYVLKKDKWIRE